MDEMKKDMELRHADDPSCAEDPCYDSTTKIVLKFVFTFITSVLILMAGIAGFKIMMSTRKPPPKKPVQARSVKVQVDEISIRDFTVEMTGNGSLQAKKTISIIPEVSGKIVYAHPDFRESGTIKKGELLYRVDQVDYVSERDRILATLDSYDTEIEYTKQMRATLEKELAQARVTLALAQEEADRVRRLFDQGAASESELNQGLLTVQSNKERIEAYESNIDLIGPSLKKIEAQKRVTQESLKQIETTLSRTEYFAPFSGKIMSGGLEVGQFIGAGQAVATFEDDSVFELPVPMSLKDMRALYPEAGTESLEANPIPVDVTWKDEGGMIHTWDGHITRLGSRLDPNTRQIDLIVTIKKQDADVRLTSGMFCEVKFLGQTLEGVAVIPRRAMRGENIVYTVEDEKLAVREVEGWRAIGEEQIIKSGLSEGDLVITSVIDEDIEGMPVTILKRNGINHGSDEAPAE
ncbi:MAG TPA: efflux RND transporter periplasmic adaptor subunit [bacterium]|nr:efflux RND transporter periplasmic adaptor subunit [bacterium]